MHGSQSEARQHMWAAFSQRPAVGTLAESLALELFSKGGHRINIGDAALFQAGNAPPFIGILRKVCTDKEGFAKLGVNWLYRPADVNLAKGVSVEAAPNEIFYSFHKDDISAASFLHPCKVAFLRKGVELPAGVSSFICRRVYDTANKCLWWLTDRDYTDEHQEEVDQLLDRTKLEMQATVQSGGPSPRTLAGPTSQSAKPGSESQNYSAPSKGKKRERTDQSVDPSKRERYVKPEENDSSVLKCDHTMKSEDIASITDKDGGFATLAGVDCLVHLMQQDRLENAKKGGEIGCRRSMLAGVIAASEREDCLDRFVQQGGLILLDDWLQEAQRGTNGDGGSPKEGEKAVEDLLLTLLQALDRLPVNLEALRACIVGKTVNHLRSHKNPEIQKRAKKLVDVWKKRVDAEMKLGEGKSGSSHGISWSSKQSPADLINNSGATPEVAVKSSGAFAGNAKVLPNGCSPGESKATVLALPGRKTSGILSPSSSIAKDGENKVSLSNKPSDVPAAPLKEEKNSGSSQPPGIVQEWTSGVSKGSTSSWKDDSKNATSATLSSKSPIPGLRSHSASGKALSGAGLTGGQKEAFTGKPLVWSRNSSNEKSCTSGSAVDKGKVDVIRVDSSGIQGRLPVRTPIPGRSSAQSGGGTALEAAAAVPAGRGVSANVTEQTGGTMSLSTADATDGQGKTQSTSRAIGLADSCAETRTASGSRILPAVEDQDKAYALKTASSDCENMNESTRHGMTDADGKSKEEPIIVIQVDYNREETMTTDGLKEVDSDVKSHHLLPVVAVDGVPVDVGGMSLLATIAAGEVSRGVSLFGGGSDGKLDRGMRCPSGVVDDGDRQCGMIEKNEKVIDGSGPNLTANQTDIGTEMEIAAIKGAQDRTPLDCVENKTNKCLTGTGAESGNDVGQEASRLISNVGEESFSDSLGGRLPFSDGGRSIVNAGSTSCLIRPLEPQHDTRPSIGGATHVCSEPGLNQDLSTSPVCNQVIHSGGGKSVRWESVPEEKKPARPHQKNGTAFTDSGNWPLVNGIDSKLCYKTNCFETAKLEDGRNDLKKTGNDTGHFAGKRGDREPSGLMSSGGSLLEDDALQVAQQVGKEAEQEVQRFGKAGSIACADVDIPEEKPEGMPSVTDTAAIGTLESTPDQRWNANVGANLADNSENSPAAHKQNSVRNVGYSEDSQETVTERREDADVGRAPGFVEGEEVDQGSSVGGCDENRNLSISEDTNCMPDGSKVESKRENITCRPIARSSSDQVGNLQHLAQNVGKPGQQNLQAGEPTTPEQATEVLGPSDGPVGGSDASERPDFDLNEGIMIEENPQDDASTTPVTSSLALVTHAAVASLPTPIAVVAATKGAFIPPASPICKGELGWKGSAATSAFRPAEPRRTPEQQQPALESASAEPASVIIRKPMRPPLDIDLNVADERGLEDGFVSSTPHSQASSVGLGLKEWPFPGSSSAGVMQADCSKDCALAHTAVKLDLDLNRIDESEESGTLLMSDLRVADAVGSSAGNEFGTSKSVVRDFDLNDGPTAEDCLAEDVTVFRGNSRGLTNPPIPVISGLRLGGEVLHVSPWFGPSNTFSGVGLPPFSTNRTEPAYPVPATAAAQYLGGVPGPATYANELYRTGNNYPVPAPAAIVYPNNSPATYSFSGYSLGSSFPFASSGGFAASSPSYLDSAGSTSFTSSVSSQTLNPGVLTAAYVRPPYLLNMTEMPLQDSTSVWARPNLDLNAGPESTETEVREDSVLLRQSGFVSGQIYDGHSKASHPGTGKRKEPEGGWSDSFKSGFSHSGWRH